MLISGSIIDFVFLGILLVLLIVGLRVGLINMVFLAGAIVLSIVLINLFADDLATLLQERIQDVVNIGPNVIQFILYVVIVVVTVVVGLILGRVLRKILKFAFLGWIDKIGGVLVGTVGMVIFSSIVSAFGAGLLFVGTTVEESLATLSFDTIPLLTGFVDWLDANIANSFIANNIALPTWTWWRGVLPDPFLGFPIETLNEAIEWVLAR